MHGIVQKMNIFSEKKISVRLGKIAVPSPVNIKFNNYSLIYINNNTLNNNLFIEYTNNLYNFK